MLQGDREGRGIRIIEFRAGSKLVLGLKNVEKCAGKERFFNLDGKLKICIEFFKGEYEKTKSLQ